MEEQLGRVIINNQTRAQDINKNWGKKKPLTHVKGLSLNV
jgi:hypothetical protein